MPREYFVDRLHMNSGGASRDLSFGGDGNAVGSNYEQSEN